MIKTILIVGVLVIATTLLISFRHAIVYKKTEDNKSKRKTLFWFIFASVLVISLISFLFFHIGSIFDVYGTLSLVGFATYVIAFLILDPLPVEKKGIEKEKGNS